MSILSLLQQALNHHLARERGSSSYHREKPTPTCHQSGRQSRLRLESETDWTGTQDQRLTGLARWDCQRNYFWFTKLFVRWETGTQRQETAGTRTWLLTRLMMKKRCPPMMRKTNLWAASSEASPRCHCSTPTDTLGSQDTITFSDTLMSSPRYRTK